MIRCWLVIIADRTEPIKPASRRDNQQQEVTTVPRYLHQFGYSTDSIKGMVTTPQDRREAAERLFSAAGGKLIDMYFCFGQFDGIAISEFPSQVDAATVALTVGASGAFSTMQTTVLIDMDEAVQAMQKAGKLSASYTPPAG